MEETNPSSPWYPYVWIDPERMGGQPCFRNTRVPVRALFDHLEKNHTVQEFLDAFPPVTREQAEAVIRIAAQGLIGADAA